MTGLGQQLAEIPSCSRLPTLLRCEGARLEAQLEHHQRALQMIRGLAFAPSLRQFGEEAGCEF